MHEMSLAMNIVELAETAARDDHANAITRIDIEVGELAGVTLDALEFSLSVAIQATMAESAELNIQFVKGSARCKNCNHTFHLEQLWAVCPECADIRFEILAGQELKVNSIDIE